MRDRATLQDVAEMIRRGRAHVQVRWERPNHPANKVDVPASVTLWIANVSHEELADLGHRSVANRRYFIAFLELNQQKALIAWGDTRKKVQEQIKFDHDSIIGPSLYYRTFRTCYGFDYDNNEYQTPAQRDEQKAKVTGALHEILK